jgi:AcrR family transcriptional regulator
MESPAKATTLRARVRAEMIDEIKQTARAQLAAQGAANLSLRAVARDLGMVSSAIYRYFAGRDELLTALIIDAYNDLGTAVEQAEAAVDRPDLAGRFAAICHTVRAWSRAHPHEYALTYGSPVPGYVAPQDTLEPGSRVSVALLRVLHEGVEAGVVRPQPGDWLSPAVHAEMADIAARAAPGVPPTVMARGMIAWTQLFGAVSFEVFGRMDRIVSDPDPWFDHQVLAMARTVGLRP